LRTYQLGPTVAAIAAFLVISSLLVVAIPSNMGSNAGEPIDEAWLVFFAMRLPIDPPEKVNQRGLRKLLADFDSDAESVADRFKVEAYNYNGGHFELKVRHENGTLYRVSLGGVRHG
jgi:hypothetical protein